VVNTELHKMDVFDQDIDSNYVGKLEKGTIRCPREDHRRSALRRALGVADDAEIGFTPFRRSRIDPMAGAEEHDDGTTRRADPSSITYRRIDPQMPNNTPHSESAFLGQGFVVIVTPLKKESINARPVMAIEDVTGAQRLGDLARSVLLRPSYETVPAGGEIDLNRENLVVICGPRISDTVAATLAQDSRFKFERAQDGPWRAIQKLVDTHGCHVE
jgi:hypothetical protein